jgi:hypothetical protein
VYFGPEEGVYFGEPLFDTCQPGSNCNTTSVTIDDPLLTDCEQTPWHFVVTAYNVVGESGPSEDVESWPRPVIEAVVVPFSPAEAMQGSAPFTLSIQGKNLTSFAFDHPGVILSATSIDCDGFDALVTVEPGQGNVPALIGDVSITLKNSNDVALTATPTLFEVLIDPARFDVNQTNVSTTDRLDGMDYIWIIKFGGLVYDPDFDFDGDGEVGGVDLMYVANGYGRCWDEDVWDWNVSACPPVSLDPGEPQDE